MRHALSGRGCDILDCPDTEAPKTVTLNLYTLTLVSTTFSFFIFFYGFGLHCTEGNSQQEIQIKRHRRKRAIHHPFLFIVNLSRYIYAGCSL